MTDLFTPPSRRQLPPERNKLRKEHVLNEISSDGACSRSIFSRIRGRIDSWNGSELLVPSWLKGGRRRYVLVGAVVLIVGTGVGVASAIINRPANNAADPLSRQRPVHFTHNRLNHWPSQYLGKTPSDILSQLVSTAGDGYVVNAQMGGPPPDVQGTRYRTRSQNTALANGLWAYVTVKAPCACPAADRAVWQAEIIGGALRDALHANGDYLVAERVSLQLPDGTTVATAGGTGANVAYEQQFNTPAASDVPAAIKQAAQGTGLTIKSVDLVNADQPAPAVIATTDSSPADAAGQIEDFANQLFGNPPRYEGFYFELQDSASNPIALVSTSFRGGPGTEWGAPGLHAQGAVSDSMEPWDGVPSAKAPSHKSPAAK